MNIRPGLLFDTGTLYTDNIGATSDCDGDGLPSAGDMDCDGDGIIVGVVTDAENFTEVWLDDLVLIVTP